MSKDTERYQWLLERVLVNKYGVGIPLSNGREPRVLSKAEKRNSQRAIDAAIKRARTNPRGETK